MQSGILRIGDVVKYSSKARKSISRVTDDREHIIKKIGKNEGGDEIVFFKDGKNYGTATSWLKLVRKWK